MTNGIFLIFALFTYITLPLATNALPNTAQGDVVHHYLPGNFSQVSSAITKHHHGALAVGDDGVLRSFDSNGTVIDFYQLDPHQIAEFAKMQLSAWQKNPSEVPESVKKLADSPKVDGRLVTEKNKIYSPPEKPHSSGKSVSKRSSPMIVGLPFPACAGDSCESLADCANPCNACYFPGGPPSGVCLV
ncbi:MAG: hypothetical protein Q9165_006102 [Trypethelium subeluteriae]